MTPDLGLIMMLQDIHIKYALARHAAAGRYSSFLMG
jgi:hypothetical protein